MNIKSFSKYSCSGCGACTTICPKKALQIELNEYGFFEAKLDDSKCINCGLCQKVCTRYEEKINGIHLKDADLFAVQSKNGNVVKRCSSGGIAHELAVQAIRENRQVVGAIYNTQKNIVEHKIAYSVDQIQQFDGSKYLQSNPQSAFEIVIDEARKNKDKEYVIFGTPCQIAGLSKVCDHYNIRNQFLLVEIFCHGVPSYKVWDEERKRIDKKLGTKSYEDVQFRYKKNDWHSYCLKVDANGKTFYGSREKEIFYQVFFENILLNDSCFHCQVRKEISKADIRLGDYWGRRFQERSDGVSAVFACTEKGKQAMQELDIQYFEAGISEEMLKAQNMNGYSQEELHKGAMNLLKEDVKASIKFYRKGLSIKQKVKRFLLVASTIIPDDIRAKLRKANSSRLLRRN